MVTAHVTRRSLLVFSVLAALALAAGVMLAHPRAAWKVARAAALHPLQTGEAINREIRAKLQRLSLMNEPVQLRFVALDGRVIDLQELRGRVVLLEFWATWCPSCMKELPHLKSVYDEYHARGFEIVGIDLDEAQDEQKLLALLAEENLQWPQYFSGDGHYMTSEVSKRFGVMGIPAMFLLDKRGRIADTNVRGERLEPAVRKLLALQISRPSLHSLPAQASNLPGGQ